MSEAIQAIKTVVNGDRLLEGMVIIELPTIEQNSLEDKSRPIETFIKYGLKGVIPKISTDSAGAGVQYYSDPCKSVIVEQWGSIASSKEPCGTKSIHVKIVIPILGVKSGATMQIGEIKASELNLGQLEEYIVWLDNKSVPLYEIRPMANPQVALCNGKSMIGEPL